MCHSHVIFYDSIMTYSVVFEGGKLYNVTNVWLGRGGVLQSAENRGLAGIERFVYTMAVVERLTGLTRRRIRYYEKCGLVRPQRTQGGHRLYSPENIETLLRIKSIMDSGITTIEAVRRMLLSGLDVPTRRQAARGVKSEAGLLGWATRAKSVGDAPVRLAKEVPAPPGSPETDSHSYFRRPGILGAAEKKPRQ